MVQIILKLMKKWANYALWKWRGWFAKTEHNNSICVFEFKLFVHCSISFNIQKHFVILLLAHPILLKKFNLIKKWERYVHYKWSGVIQAQINDLKIQFPFLNFSSLYIVPLFFYVFLKKNLLSKTPIVKKILNLIKEWTSYAYWKWKGWFAKIDHMLVQLMFLTLYFFYIFSFFFTLQRKLVNLKIMHLKLFKSLRMDK